MQSRRPTTRRPIATRAAAAAARVLGWLAVAGLFSIAGLGAFNLLAPRLHLVPVVITGGSMAPGIARGSLVIAEPVPTETLVVGDVVTVLEPTGRLVTHRIVRLATLHGAQYLETRGDASRGPDPVLLPASSVVGRLVVAVPALGYLEWLLTRPLGWLTVASVLAAVLLCELLLRELTPVRRGGPSAEALARGA
jgi:signal peptidase I